MFVLVACEESQRVCSAFRKRGHLAYSCDIQDCSGNHPEWHIKGDCLPLLNGNCQFKTQDGSICYLDGRWDIIIAHPPCTHLCNSGQRWFTEGKKPYSLQREAIAFFYKFVTADCKRIAIENPVGIMSTAYRKPDQIIEPWMFGDPENKKTCLWLKGLPLLYSTDIVSQEFRRNSVWLANFNGKQYSWNNPETARLRSQTFPGIALAMANQWG